MKEGVVQSIDKIAQLPREFQFLEDLIEFRVRRYYPGSGPRRTPVFPTIDSWHEPIRDFVVKHGLNDEEAILILIALAPHLQPDLFDRAIERAMRNADKGEGEISGGENFPKIGGVRGTNSRAFLPTGETALFLLCGETWEKRLEVQKIFWANHLFSIKKIIWLEELGYGEPIMSGKLIMSPDYISLFTFGESAPPHFSMSFPAKRIDIQLMWQDLVISDELREQLREISNWILHNDELMNHWGMHKRLKKGYRALFYGPPGTGKTVTAGLLGKYAAGLEGTIGKPVYKIDLSMVVSKYIGETEKHLDLIFAKAEAKGWILFFDEADALFGKRTNVKDAHDKYANQEVSYLLQRIEEYDGLVILATNMKNNIDDAFMRRFNAILKFPFPNALERARIWEKAFPKAALFHKEEHKENANERSITANTIDIPELVKKYELSGGSIMNVVHYSCLKAIERSKRGNIKTATTSNQPGPGAMETENNKLNIYLDDVLEGIRREMIKEGKPFG